MKLTKKIIPITEADKVIDRSFKEIGSKKSNITISSFFRLYNDIFYRIPKNGVESHTTIFNKSGEFLENPETRNVKEIKQLNNKIKDIQSKLSQLEHQNEMLKADNRSKEIEIRELKES